MSTINLEDIDLVALLKKHKNKQKEAMKELRQLTGIDQAEALDLMGMAATEIATKEKMAKSGTKALFEGGLGEAAANALLPGEPIICAMEGMMGQGIILTDGRVIIVKAGAPAGSMFAQKAKAFRLQDITSVEYSLGWSEGRIQISAAGTAEAAQGWAAGGLIGSRKSENVCQFMGGYKTRFKLMSQRIQAAVYAAGKPAATVAAPTMDIPDQIRKLKELVELGVLTPAEFEAKKQELLARM